VARLKLDDGELAVLLAHEVAHIVAEHERETLSEALLDSHRDLPLDVVDERLASDIPLQLRLSKLSAIQEREADQLGMLMAFRAGWPCSAMLRFYAKLAEDSAGPTLLASHPSGTTRLSLAKGMSRLLGN
jgi:predicted Zn-dependent protease